MDYRAVAAIAIGLSVGPILVVVHFMDRHHRVSRRSWHLIGSMALFGSGAAAGLVLDLGLPLALAFGLGGAILGYANSRALLNISDAVQRAREEEKSS